MQGLGGQLPQLPPDSFSCLPLFLLVPDLNWPPTAGHWETLGETGPEIQLEQDLLLLSQPL